MKGQGGRARFATGVVSGGTFNIPAASWKSEFKSNRWLTMGLGLAVLVTLGIGGNSCFGEASLTDRETTEGASIKAPAASSWEKLLADVESTEEVVPGRYTFEQWLLRSVHTYGSDPAMARESSAAIQAEKATGLYRFGECVIDIQENQNQVALTVYGWEGRLLSRRIFSQEEFEALGGYTGLWIPKVQPLKNTFLINKFGAYAGRTVLITEEGHLLEFAGGLYALDEQVGRLFLLEDTDIDGLVTVLDQQLNLVCAARRLEDLRDSNGKQIFAPDRLNYVCLPALREDRADGQEERFN